MFTFLQVLVLFVLFALFNAVFEILASIVKAVISRKSNQQKIDDAIASIVRALWKYKKGGAVLGDMSNLQERIQE